jgi:NADPH:quinone reductase-like Zn-dependent oxidoreductase
MASTMRMVAAEGWRYARPGPPTKVLQYEKFRLPFDRRSSNVVVKMLSAPVHTHDKNLIEGNYGHVKPLQYPAIGGTEGVGIVEEVGSNVQLGVKAGDLVWINNPRVGTWATHIVTHVNNVDVLPNRPDLEIEWLGSMGTFHTAWNLVHGFEHLQPGDVVLQNGASSSVAQLCMAFARSRGAKPILTMQQGRTEHTHLVTRFKLCGAYCVVPYSYARTNYMRRLLSDLPPPKLFLNHTGGPLASTMVKLLGDGGTVVSYGSMSRQPLQVSNMDLIQRELKFKSFFLPSHMEQQSREARMRTLLGLGT